MRLKILRLIIVGLLLALAGDLFYLQVMRGAYYHRLSAGNRIRVIPTEAPRGRIRDRNGVLLADNRLSFDVSVIPQDVRDTGRLFSFLAKALGRDVSTIEANYRRRRRAPFAPVVVAEDVPLSEAMALQEERYRFPGLYIQEAPRRVYLFREVGAHLLGYIGEVGPRRLADIRRGRPKAYGYAPKQLVGYSGIEEQYDDWLRGRDGGIQIEVNSRGRQVRLLGIREPRPGRDIRLTVDHTVQQVAAEVLGGDPGAIVVMGLETGEILGMVSSPSFDPNILVDARKKSLRRRLFQGANAPLLNRVIKGLYPPGSVFKLVMAAAGLTTGKVSAETTFRCDGYLLVGGRRFRCAHVHGVIDLIDAIAHSCNVYFFHVGDLLGPETIGRFARLFGLGRRTRVDLPSEERGLIPGPRRRKAAGRGGWFRGDTLNLSIGQGDVLVTPLQLTVLMARIAQDGRRITPRLIRRIGDRDVVAVIPGRIPGIPAAVYPVLQEGLRRAVSDPSGTAHVLALDGFHVAGKTGTAQSGGGREHHSWFVGYDRTTKIPVAFSVFLEHGGSSYNACLRARTLLVRLREAGVL